MFFKSDLDRATKMLMVIISKSNYYRGQHVPVLTFLFVRALDGNMPRSQPTSVGLRFGVTPVSLHRYMF